MQDAGNPRPGATDQWAAWLAERRHGADPEYLRQTLEFLAPMRDLVIANAKIVPDSQVLDVGCGDGLIALQVAETVGPTGQVIFSDISSDLLERCKHLAEGPVSSRDVRSLRSTPSARHHGRGLRFSTARVTRASQRSTKPSNRRSTPRRRSASLLICSLVERGDGRRRIALAYLWALR